MTDTTSPTPTPAPAPRKRSLGKLLLRLVGLLVLLVVVGLVVLYAMRNTLVRAGVVRGGTYATGQSTLLDAADLSLGSGALGLNQFKIGNPAGSGYKEASFLTMRSCNVGVETGSLLSSTVVIDKIEIIGLEIYLEQIGAKNNLAEIMDVIKKKTAAAAPAGQGSESPGKKLKINRITLIDTVVHLRGIVSFDFKLPPIQMDDPTNPDGRNMKIADLIGKILLHVAQQIVENPQLPGDFKKGLEDVTKLVDALQKDLSKDLTKGLTGLQNLGKDAGKNLQDVGKNLQDTGKNLQDAGKDAGKNLQDMGKNLQNLIPGNRPPASQPK